MTPALRLPIVALLALATVTSGALAQAAPSRAVMDTVHDTVMVAVPQSATSGDRKDPAIAGIFSLVIPGAGSLYAGNTAHALVHFGVNVVSSVVVLGSLASAIVCTNYSCSNDRSATVGPIALDVLIVNDIWSVFTAVRDTQVHNNRLAAPQPGRVVGSLYFAPAVVSLTSQAPRIPGMPASQRAGYQLGSISF